MTRFGKTLRLVAAAVPFLSASPSHAGFLLSGTFLEGATPQIQLDLKSDTELGTGFDVWVMDVELSPFSEALDLKSVEALLRDGYEGTFVVLVDPIKKKPDPKFPGYRLFGGKVIPQDEALKGLLRWTFAAPSNPGPIDFSAAVLISGFAGETEFNVPPIEVRTQVFFAVPEPSTWALLVWGLFALGFVAGRRRNAG